MGEQNIATITKEQNPRRITQPFVIVGCLVEKDGRFLLIHQNGKWNHPCGWLEMEENLVDGAKREAEEEIGLEVEIKGLIGVYTLIKHKGEKILHAVKFIFKAQLTGKEAKHQDNLRYGWFTVTQMKTMDFWDPDVPMIAEQAMRNRIYSLQVISNTTAAK